MGVSVRTARLVPARWSVAVRLPRTIADFGRRGFRTDRPAARHLLQGHAEAFLAGFDLAGASWPDVHEALAGLPAFERGFAYEGAAMHAALRDTVTRGRARALETLLAGPGDGYVHLVHVGYGWGLGPVRPGWIPRLPGTPLLRWLALDGAGFAGAFFAGMPAVRRLAQRPPGAERDARLAGCGRALWFIQAADAAGVAAAIESVPQPARPHLWAGVGLAAAYAGGAGGTEIDDLVELSSAARTAFGQGVFFAGAARARSGVVPPYTEEVCDRVLGMRPADAGRCTDETSADLGEPGSLTDFLEWKARLRSAVPGGVAVREA